MSETKRRVIKYKPKRKINVGAVVFVIIFIYLISYMFLYVTRDKISYYEVVYGTTSSSANKSFEGIILREELVVKAGNNGYVSHHLPDCSKTSIGKTVCSIDESGKLASIFAESQNGTSTLSQDDFNDIKNEISNFSQIYDNNDFECVYTFKSEMQSLISEKINYNNINNLSEITSEDVSSYFKVSNATSSGIVTYYTDGYEEVNFSNVTSSVFYKDNYKKVIRKTNELVSEDTPIYKIITSEDWGILFKLDDETYETLKDRTRLEIRINDSSKLYEFDFEIINLDGDNYAKLTTNLHMISFIGQRFVDVKIENNTVSGLKIPKTSLVDKDFYIIPKEFGTKGGNTNTIGFMVETYDKDNNMSVEYMNPEIYSETDEYYYVSMQAFEDKTCIHKVGTDEVYYIGAKDVLKGVYNINNGYCVFREVKIIDENSDYYIVKSGTNYGLLVYDHIVLDSSLVNEEDIVFR